MLSLNGVTGILHGVTGILHGALLLGEAKSDLKDIPQEAGDFLRFLNEKLENKRILAITWLGDLNEDAPKYQRVISAMLKTIESENGTFGWEELEQKHFDEDSKKLLHAYAQLFKEVNFFDDMKKLRKAGLNV